MSALAASLGAGAAVSAAMYGALWLRDNEPRSRYSPPDERTPFDELVAYRPEWSREASRGGGRFFGGEAELLYFFHDGLEWEYEEFTTGWPVRIYSQAHVQTTGLRHGGGRTAWGGGPGSYVEPQSFTTVDWSETRLAMLGLCGALLAGLPGLLLSTVRRRRRMRHGLCPMCRYPRGASDTCAECGYVHGIPVDEG